MGQLPISISGLTSLITLDLSTHFFSPSLSLKLGNLNLSTLVENLTKLQGLYLDGVKISVTGNEWCQALSSSLPARQVLSLCNCYLSGPIDQSLGKLQTLSVLRLDKNNLSAQVPGFLANSSKLTALHLSSRGLNETFPKEIFQAPTLQTLDISNNEFLQGSLPEFHKKSALQHLVISNTSFSGELPTSIGNLSNLLTLELANCQFNGTLSDSLTKLTKLVHIDLSFNQFNGPIPYSLFSIPSLQEISLSHNNLSGQLREYDSSSVSKISTLKLASCKLKSFPYLKHQSRLVHLDLSDNQIDGDIPNWIWEVGNGSLLHLNLSHNQLVGIQEPYSIPNLTVLDLHSNKLHGTIPILPPYGINYIDFSSHFFASSIPVDIGHSLLATIFFSLSNNSLLGIIPESICNAGNLEVLDLSYNNLTGRIPTCVSAIMSKTLGVLNLRRNKFSSLIPDAFPVSCSLEILHLHKDMIEGEAPQSLANCTTLKFLNLDNNKMTDRFPCWLKKISILESLFWDPTISVGALDVPIPLMVLIGQCFKLLTLLTTILMVNFQENG